MGLEVLAEREFGRLHGMAWRFRARLRGRGDGHDDLSAYKPVAERLEVARLIYVARVKKWARNRLDKIEGKNWIKARIWRLLTELTSDVDLELHRLERAVRDGDETLRCLRARRSGR